MSTKYQAPSIKTASEIFSAELNFERVALEIFQFQAKENPVYKKYIEQLKIVPEKIKSIELIPFLPIQFFKTHQVITQPQTSSFKPETFFSSSGTTGNVSSKHYIVDLNIYEQSFLKCFELFYGDIEEYCLLALLPSYLDKNDSSLIYMTDLLIKRSNHSQGGFYLNEFEKLALSIENLIKQKQKFILLGVTYALLDFSQWLKSPFWGANGIGIFMETGGMKGKRKELLREEIHEILGTAFGMDAVHSEYGMTELLSQAYSKENGIYFSPPWMKIFIRDINDPMLLVDNNISGGINIIDLANIYSCSFIATQDLGKKYSNESFEVLGRFDDSDLRGCNLMIE